MGGGKDRRWLTELTPEGNIRTDDPNLDSMVGCHKDQFVHLNILNPQPGMEYCWVRNTGRDKMLYRQKGYRVVGADDPEMAAMNQVMADGPTPLDSSDVYGDVILMKAPAEAVRQIRGREQAKAQAQMRGGAADYADKAAAIEEQLSRGLPPRFRRRDHILEFKDGQENTVDVWQPEDGIIRES